VRATAQPPTNRHPRRDSDLTRVARTSCWPRRSRRSFGRPHGIESVTALRSEHDTLAGIVSTLTDDQLAATSGAAEWTVGLDHFPLRQRPHRSGQTVAAEDDQTIWARWDSSEPRAQVEGFLEHNGRRLETVEALTPSASGQEHE
jgi:hypothetical protein